LEAGRLNEGADADITIIDPDKGYTVDAERFASKSKNSPFIGKEVRGVVETVIVAGQLVLENGKFVLEKRETENSKQ
jgi:dihydroorotase